MRVVFGGCFVLVSSMTQHYICCNDFAFLLRWHCLGFGLELIQMVVLVLINELVQKLAPAQEPKFKMRHHLVASQKAIGAVVPRYPGLQ